MSVVEYDPKFKRKEESFYIVILSLRVRIVFLDILSIVVTLGKIDLRQSGPTAQ